MCSRELNFSLKPWNFMLIFVPNCQYKIPVPVSVTNRCNTDRNLGISSRYTSWCICWTGSQFRTHILYKTQYRFTKSKSKFKVWELFGNICNDGILHDSFNDSILQISFLKNWLFTELPCMINVHVLRYV